MADSIKNQIEYVPTILEYFWARSDASLLARNLSFQNNLGNTSFRNKVEVDPNDTITLVETRYLSKTSAQNIIIKPNTLVRMTFEGSKEERYFAHISIPRKEKDGHMHFLYSFDPEEKFGAIGYPKYVGYRLNSNNSQILSGSPQNFLSRVTKLNQQLPIRTIAFGTAKSKSES